MRIGVDAGCLAVDNDRLKVGVYVLSFNLIKELTKLDKVNQYLLYSFTPISSSIMGEFGPKVENRVLTPKKFWLSLRLSWEFFKNQSDIFLGLGQALPLFHPGKNLVFVYDLAFEYYPRCYSDSYRRLSRQTRFAVRHAQKMIAISNSTKNDLVKIYGVDEKKIEVIYPGVESIFRPQPFGEIRKIKEKYNLKKPYFLFVGSLKPIKNIPQIIEAFYEFRKKVSEKYKLVLVGSDFWLDKEISSKIKKLKLGETVINLGYIPREDLPGIYAGAFTFVSPSLYEGFGIPLLEAMACGVPVVTSNTGSMPEVAGDAALLADPSSPAKIADALIGVAKNPQLREDFRRKGLRRAREFSWKKFAHKILDLINV